MKMSVLASGSTGNCICVDTDSGSILVDVGRTSKRTELALNKIERSLNDIDAILITHEHSDHIKGLKVIAKRYNIPIFANKKTWEAIESKNIHVNEEQKIEINALNYKKIIEIDVES